MRNPLLLSLLAWTLAVPLARAADDYKPGPDSLPQPGVPLGTVTKHSFTNSGIFPGTARDYWVYVPAQYDPDKPACLMVFQDGLLWNATNVFNNLIHKKEIPVLIGVFVQPGVVPALSTNALPRFNRSFEYDSLGERYALFLIEELLPEVRKNYSLSTNASDGAIAGSSSGGICAFTVAWERPDAFRRVFSSIGSFTDLRGGNVYPALIRKTEPKPLRVFLQDGSGDLNIYSGSWWIANQDVLSALQFAGYAVTNVWGDGAHSGKHATAIFPDALRWLWQDWPAPVRANAESKSKQPVMDVLIPGEEWEKVTSQEEHGFIENLAVNPAGEVFFSLHGTHEGSTSNVITKVGVDGSKRQFASVRTCMSKMTFGPDGRLYFGVNDPPRIVALDESGKATEFATVPGGFTGLVSLYGGRFLSYYGVVNAKGQWREHPIFAQPGSEYDELFGCDVLGLSPDQSLVFFRTDRPDGRTVLHSAQVQPDGALRYPQRFAKLHGFIWDSGMTADREGRLYVYTTAGVEMVDATGRVIGIISVPKDGRQGEGISFGGPRLDELYLASGQAIFKRPTKATGVLSCQPPIKPAKPRL